MDPASLSNLDPKLKETYDRVMGAPSPAPGSTPSASPSTDSSQAMSSSTNTTNETLSPIPAQHPQNVTINQPLPQTPSASAIVTKPHGHSGLIRIFYIL